MTDLHTAVTFKSLTAQTSAVLLARGMEVEPTAVQGVLAHVVTVTADERHEGAEDVHAVRPVRFDARTVPTELGTLGRLAMAAAQAGKYAATDHDSWAAAHLMDVATELGAALTTDNGPIVPVGLLDEPADHLDRTIARIEKGEWSICPCGGNHDQDDVDTGAVRTMRHDAPLARNLRRRSR